MFHTNGPRGGGAALALSAFPVLSTDLTETPLPHSWLFLLQFASSGVACALSCAIFGVLMRAMLFVRPTIPTADVIGVPVIDIKTRNEPTIRHPLWQTPTRNMRLGIAGSQGACQKD